MKFRNKYSTACIKHLYISEPLQWVFSWTEMVSLRYMVPMFEKCFFSRWLQVLCTWLGNGPNYDEVTKWYLGWKSVFSEQYLSHPVVKGNKGRIA